jgi:hypothetical protein
MRILLTIAHYFKATENPKHASENANYKNARKANIERIIRTWRGVFEEYQTLQIGDRRYEKFRGPATQLNIEVVQFVDCSLITKKFADAQRLTLREVQINNPKMLPFAAHHILREKKNQYDWYVYSEDDLLVTDPLVFKKLEAFNKQFGYKRILQPNRFELNPSANLYKTYIDGDLKPETIDPLNCRIADEEFLNLPALESRISLRRARNPHSGCFFLHADQLEYWTSKKTFLDMDVSFISPLESAATLGIAKNFAIYKPFGKDTGFFEIEHLDNGYSNIPAKPQTPS